MNLSKAIVIDAHPHTQSLLESWHIKHEQIDPSQKKSVSLWASVSSNLSMNLPLATQEFSAYVLIGYHAPLLSNMHTQ